MGKGKSRDYKNGMRGHSWKGRGADRKCSKCGAKPKNHTGLPGPVAFTEGGKPKVDENGKFELLKLDRLTGTQKKRKELARKANRR